MKEFVLDTKGLCFLCLEKVFTGRGDNSLPCWMTDICLRNICRFLKINPRGILNKSRKAFETEGKCGGEFPSTSESCDFSVTFCEKCFTVTNKLTSMIKEFDLIKLSLSQRLRTFYRILQGSQRQHNTISNAWETVETAPSQLFYARAVESELKMEAKLIDTLRQETVDKCRIYIAAQTSALPRVLLRRFDDPSVQKSGCHSPESEYDLSDSKLTDMKPNCIQPTTEKFQKGSCLSSQPTRCFVSGNEMKTEILEISEWNENSDAANLISDMKVDSLSSSIGGHDCGGEEVVNSVMEVDTLFFSATTPADYPEFYVRSKQANVSTSTSSNSKRESHSLPESQSKLNHNNWMNSASKKHEPHKACLHPEKVFAAKKLSHISETTFKEISRMLWVTEAERALSRHSTSLAQECKENLRLDCEYCKRTFAKQDCLLCHYVECHYQTLTEKLLKLQTNYQDNSVRIPVEGEVPSTSSNMPQLTLPSPVSLTMPLSIPTNATSSPPQFITVQPSVSFSFHNSSPQHVLQYTTLPLTQPNCSSSSSWSPPKPCMLPPVNEILGNIFSQPSSLQANYPTIQTEQTRWLYDNSPNNILSHPQVPIMNGGEPSSSLYNYLNTHNYVFPENTGKNNNKIQEQCFNGNDTPKGTLPKDLGDIRDFLFFSN